MIATVSFFRVYKPIRTNLTVNGAMRQDLLSGPAVDCSTRCCDGAHLRRLSRVYHSLDIVPRHRLYQITEADPQVAGQHNNCCTCSFATYSAVQGALDGIGSWAVPIETCAPVRAAHS